MLMDLQQQLALLALKIDGARVVRCDFSFMMDQMSSTGKFS